MRPASSGGSVVELAQLRRNRKSRCGTVHLVDFEPARESSKADKVRPGMIASNDSANTSVSEQKWRLRELLLTTSQGLAPWPSAPH